MTLDRFRHAYAFVESQAETHCVRDPFLLNGSLVVMLSPVQPAADLPLTAYGAIT
jgi:hypothetical protein